MSVSSTYTLGAPDLGQGSIAVGDTTSEKHIFTAPTGGCYLEQLMLMTGPTTAPAANTVILVINDGGGGGGTSTEIDAFDVPASTNTKVCSIYLGLRLKAGAEVRFKVAATLTSGSTVKGTLTASPFA